MSLMSFEKTKNILLGLLLVLILCVLFMQVAHHEFVDWDDVLYLVDNPFLQKGLNAETLTWALTADLTFDSEHSIYWSPVPWIAMLIEAHFIGLDPGRHHLINLAWHILNTLLVFTILVGMTARSWPSFFVALLFSIHPLQVETVCWITARKDLLAHFFGLLCLLFYCGSYARLRRFRLALILCFYILSLLSKPVYLLLPLLLVALDFWPIGRKELSTFRLRAWMHALREKTPFILVACGYVLLVMNSAAHHFGIKDRSLYEIFAQSVLGYLWFIKALLVPVNLMVPIREFWNAIPGFHVLAALLVSGLLFLLAWRQREKRPFLFAGLIWFSSGILIMLPLSIPQNRFMYMPCLGLIWGVVWTVAGIKEQKPVLFRILCIAGAVYFAGLFMLSWTQTGYWKDSVSFFSRAVQLNPENPYARRILGSALVRIGKTQQGIGQIEKALELKPDYARAMVRLGDVYLRIGEKEKASEYYGKAGEVGGGEISFSIGSELAKNGYYADAHKYFARAVQAQPLNVEAQNNLANSLIYLGRRGEAAAVYLKVLEISPCYAKAHNNLANLFSEEGRLRAARTHYEQALVCEPDFALAYYNFGNLHLRSGRNAEAVKYYRKAHELDPDHPGARRKLKELSD